MDIRVIRDKFLGTVKKYRYVLIILIAGIMLMLLPDGGKNDAAPHNNETEQRSFDIQISADQLEEILSKIKGVGNVEVLLTFSAGERNIYHSDERRSSSDTSQSTEENTILVSDSSRSEVALVEQVLGPEYLGAVIVCQGAGDPSVRLAVSDAVGKATGLGADRISVLKMK